MGLSLAEWIENNDFSDLEEDIKISLREGTSIRTDEIEQVTRLIMILIRQKITCKEQDKKIKNDLRI